MALDIGIQNVCMDTRGDIFLKAITLWDASMPLSSCEERGIDDVQEVFNSL